MPLTTGGRNERKKVNECIHNTPLRITPEHENKKYEIRIEGHHEKRI